MSLKTKQQCKECVPLYAVIRNVTLLPVVSYEVHRGKEPGLWSEVQVPPVTSPLGDGDLARGEHCCLAAQLALLSPASGCCAGGALTGAVLGEGAFPWRVVG